MTNEYVIWFVAALVASVVLTPLLGKLAQVVGIIDKPAKRKFHVSATPLFGGVAISLATVIVVVVSLKLRSELSMKYVAVLSVSMVMMVLGLLDDIRTVSPRLRLIVQAIVTGVLVMNGLKATLTGIAPIDYVLTFLWVVGIMNCINLMDNMDGLAGGTSAIASCFFFVAAIVTGKPMVAMIAVAFSGACLGFLFHNFHPASIFSGDAGSMFMGVILAALGLFIMEPRDLVSHMIPPVILGTIIFDTGLVTVLRLANGHKITDGGKDHTSHRLCNVGFSVPAAVSTLFVGSLFFGFSGLLELWLRPNFAFIYSLVLIVLLIIAGYSLKDAYDYSNHVRREDSGEGGGGTEAGSDSAVLTAGNRN